MEQAAEKISFRTAKHSDLKDMQKLFVDTIEQTCGNDYTKDQINAWTASVNNHLRWANLIEKQWVLLAEEGNNLAGFISLEKPNYLDMFYVLPQYQKHGVGRTLYNRLLEEYNKDSRSQLYANVSITAKKFFEARGFVVKEENTVIRNGVEITNYKMVLM